jgi:hypothetical protein
MLIMFSQYWPSRLDEALAGAWFLIPMLSPLFFRSEPCRDEPGKFLELKRRAGRRDMILPIYLVTAPVLVHVQGACCARCRRQISVAKRLLPTLISHRSFAEVALERKP